MNYTTEINGHTLEYIDEGHLYVIDGILVPSITQILHRRFGGRYDRISQTTLQRAAEKGTELHEAIEAYCKTGIEADLVELRNFKALQAEYGFSVLENEVPVILFDGEDPISAGRLDLVIEINGQIGGADIKRTYKLDTNYLAYQLNLYRLAYRQSYGIELEFLRGIHLREEVKQFVTLPINEEETLNMLKEDLK